MKRQGQKGKALPGRGNSSAKSLTWGGAWSSDPEKASGWTTEKLLCPKLQACELW